MSVGSINIFPSVTFGLIVLLIQFFREYSDSFSLSIARPSRRKEILNRWPFAGVQSVVDDKRFPMLCPAVILDKGRSI